MTKPRIVTVLVTDDSVHNLVVTFTGPAPDQRAIWRGDAPIYGGAIIPVPEDDTLLRDIDYVTTFVEVMSPDVIDNGGDEVTEAAAALRARFHLDDDQ